MGKHQFSSDRIINIDETRVTTVMQAPKVVAPTGVKQIGQTVSVERGELVTVCGIVSASGNTIPSAYIFPRIKYKDSFLAGGPIGSVGFSSLPFTFHFKCIPKTHLKTFGLEESDEDDDEVAFVCHFCTKNDLNSDEDPLVLSEFSEEDDIILA